MAAGEPSSAAPVERLGRYEILGEIASGGMATVFLGRVTGAKGFQRLVAIKRLHPHLESEEDFVAMFLDEARLAARIRHQNVVGTLDVEDQAGLYIVMEYIEGDRLLGLLRHAAKSNERIPIPVAIRIALDTLAGLHAAHELNDDDGEALGLVHRDVSPQNILVGVDGVARLTDFGIAKATSRLTVTRDGQLKGKIAYMAPEQTKKVEIDRRVDIFAMGIIAWEMFTSKKLFQGESDVEVLNQLLFEPIPKLRESAPGVPPAIDAAVMKALERDPVKRYSTAAEFADALERASKILGGPANARTVAAHLQKVSADKLAKDRARFTAPGAGDSGPTPSRVQRRPTNPGANIAATLVDENPPDTGPSRPRVPTGAHPAVQPPPPLPSRTATARYNPTPAVPLSTPRVTLGGTGAPVSVPSRTATAMGNAPPAPAPSAPKMDLGPTLVDDDEDVPTSLSTRPVLADMAKPILASQSASAPVAPPAKPPSPAVKPAAPAIGPPPSWPPAGAAPAKPASSGPAIGPPPVAGSQTFIVPVREEEPKTKSRVVPMAGGAALVVGAAIAAVIALRGGDAPSGAAAHVNLTARTVSAPTPNVTSQARTATPPPPPSVGATSPPPTQPANHVATNPPPTPPPSSPAPPTNAAPNPPPPSNVAANPAPNSPPAAEAPHHHSHSSSTSSSSSSHANTSAPSATSHPANPAPATNPPPQQHHHNDDDPFGNDNPYQR